MVLQTPVSEEGAWATAALAHVDRPHLVTSSGTGGLSFLGTPVSSTKWLCFLPPIRIGSWALPESLRHTLFSHLPPASTMASTSQPPKGRDTALSALDVFIQVLTLAKETCGILPARIAFGTASVLLTMIRVCLALVVSEDELLTRLT